MKEHSNMINKISEEVGVDPDLVRAAMMIENSQGWYDPVAEMAQAMVPDAGGNVRNAVRGTIRQAGRAVRGQDFHEDKIHKTALPMNIAKDGWADLGITPENFDDPETNIRAGARILKALSNRIPEDDPNRIAKIGTLYNSLRATQTSDYGARFGAIYQNKSWDEDVSFSDAIMFQPKKIGTILKRMKDRYK